MKSAPARPALCLRLERQIQDQGSRVALQSEADRRSFTFAELGERIAAWGGVLRRAGIDEGQTVALATGNVPSFVELFFALRSIDASVLLLDDAASLSVAAKMGASWALRRGGEGRVPAGSPDPLLRLAPVAPEI